MKPSIQNTRLSYNSNLTLYAGPSYRELPIQVVKGPFALEYLEKLYETIQCALADYSRIFAIRFDLHYPRTGVLPDDASSGSVIQRFVESLKAKIRHDRSRAAGFNKRVHDTVVRYVWAKEYGSEGRPHYHVLILLNRDAYHTLGNFTSDQENTYSRIQSAWASALHIDWHQSRGLVHIPDNPTYYVSAHKENGGLPELFHRASYLCKVGTKKYGDGCHAFGSSRN